jgi:hypothetical protein
MERLLFYAFVALASWAAAMPAAASDGDLEIDYEIFLQGDQVAVSLDLARLITSARVERLKEGVDIAVEYRLLLSRPRRIWGTEKVSEVTGLLRLGYRLVTEDFYLRDEYRAPEDERHFPTLAPLHQFLSDSIVERLTDYEELDTGKRYELEITVSCISLTDFNVPPTGASREPESPVKYLFRQFLQLTGYGRDEYSAKSRAFSPLEWEPRE